MNVAGLNSITFHIGRPIFVVQAALACLPLRLLASHPALLFEALVKCKD